MFIKNSFTFLSLVLWILPFYSSSRPETSDLNIPSMHIEQTIKNSNEIEIHDNLKNLHFNDQIILKKNNETYYYRVMDKMTKEEFSKKSMDKENTIVLYTKNNSSTLQTIIIATNTGKMVKN